MKIKQGKSLKFRNSIILFLTVIVVSLTTSQIIISTVGVFSPISPMGELTTNSEDYPVFIMDIPFPSYCGLQLKVMFTAFSNASGMIRIHTLVNGIENPIFAPMLEGYYFVNYEHIIDTSGLVTGEKEIELFLEDSDGKTKSISHTVIVDKTAPQLTLQYSASRIYHKDPLGLKWNVTDLDPITYQDYFDRIEFWVDGEIRGTRNDKIGSINLFFFLPIDVTSQYYTIEVFAYDLANNFAYQYLAIEIYRPEEEQPPDNWEEELEQLEEERRRTAWGAGISALIGAILAIGLFVPLATAFIRRTGYQRSIDSNDYEGAYDDYLQREEFDDDDGLVFNKEGTTSEAVIADDEPLPIPNEGKPPKIKKIVDEPNYRWWQFRKRWKQKYGADKS